MEHHSSRRHHHHHSDGSSDAGKNRSHHHSSSRHEHGRHHSSSSSTLKWGGDSSGPKKLAGIGAFLCGAFGFVAISIHIIIRIVYAKNDEMPVFYLNLVSLAFAAVAFVCGFYGEIVLIRYPSRRLRLKLFFGMLITMFAIAISGFNLYRHYQLPALHGSHVAPAEETAGDTAVPLSYPTATPPNLPASPTTASNA